MSDLKTCNVMSLRFPFVAVAVSPSLVLSSQVIFHLMNTMQFIYYLTGGYLGFAVNHFALEVWWASVYLSLATLAYKITIR